MTKKLDATTLRKIIFEELQKLQEGTSEDAAADLVLSASKLLKALETFKDSMKDKAKVRADLDAHVQEMEKFLKRVITSPLQYVDAPKPVVKKVSLKPAGKVM